MRETIIPRAELKVIQVQVLLRHGDRTPNKHEIYPNDIHNASSYEPWGHGQLTNMGKMRVYQLGQLLKTRYQELLGPLYVPEAVHAVSSDVARCKTSLQLVLAGLFPPSEAEMWNSELPWMPIPIHYVPFQLVITINSFVCPEFADAIAEVMQLPEVQAKIAVHKDFFEFISAKTGLANISKPEEVFHVHNILVIQKAMNLSWPEWCTDVIFQQMRELAFLQYDIWCYTTRAKRIRSGPLIKKFIENMCLNGTQENLRKMYLYSAHEATLSGFLQSIGILEPKIPEFGSAVMIEKLQDSDGNIFVRIVMWTGVTERLITLRLPGCDDLCPIETFLRVTREVIPSDEELDCHWKLMSTEENIRRAFE